MDDIASRDRIAGQLLKGRNYDRKNEYMNNRDLAGYIHEIEGLQYFLSYVRDNQKVLGSNLVLDIGAGNSVATSQLRDSSWSEGLRVEATTLSSSLEARKNLGNNLHITPVETLRGIVTNSVAAVISVYGLSYSESAFDAVRSLNRVMVPSGILKATFYLHDRPNSQVMDPKTSAIFEEEFERIDWKVIIDRPEKRGFEILFAIKPPLLKMPEEIIRLDKESYNDQFKKAYVQYPPL